MDPYSSFVKTLKSMSSQEIVSVTRQIIVRRMKRTIGNILALSWAQLPDIHKYRSSGVISDDNSTLVLMSASFGSMGDQALAGGINNVSRQNGVPVRLLVPGDVAPWIKVGISDVATLDEYALAKWSYVTAAGSAVFRSSNVTVIGADTIDGKYGHEYLSVRVRALNLAARNGHRAKLVNFSMSETPTPISVRLLKKLDSRVELWARDERSRARAATILRREVQLAPDIGMFMTPEVTTSVTSVIKKTRDRSLVVLVPNAHFATDFGIGYEKLRAYWINLAEMLTEHSNVIVMPHDTRTHPDDVGFCRAIVDNASSGQFAVHLFVPQSAGEAKGLVSAADLCISARMHACVGALSSGVPTIGLDYLEKFEGQFQWFSDLGHTIEFERSLNLDDMRTLVDRSLLSGRTGESAANRHTDTMGWLC